MNFISFLPVVVLAGLVHASFQLSLSVLTLLSSHALGRRTPQKTLLRLSGSFLLGVTTMTILLLSSLAHASSTFIGHTPAQLVWASATGIAIGLGVAVWIFYYRRDKGTALWIPYSFAAFLTERVKRVRSSAESFSLGLASVLAETLFILPTMAIAVCYTAPLTAREQLAALGLYLLVGCLPLTIITIAIARGASISRIQHWRERNKRFLQFAAGSALTVLGFYLYVEQVISVPLVVTGGGF